ncbi:DNA-processing protein DprA [Pseudomonas sp. ESBL2]|uniref:DNA-processing protein DprA n=1 Tax=Pseudomonas sp. ESBL2 TaxID=3077325 RepID=UPI002FCC48A4
MIEISEVTTKVLALSMLAGIGPATLRRIASIEAFRTSSVESLGARVPALARALSDPLAWVKALELVEKQVEMAGRYEARIISALDPEYPLLLKATKDDPFILFVKGRLFDNPERSVAIIGTRQPTRHGELIAKRVVEFFVEQRWSVVSGLALGCDSIAHRAALEANGHTVAVMAHGLQTVAPSQHRKLAEDILASGGALVSEYRFGQGALPMQFVKRDRTQAGLAQGVVMVQSDIKGGSLHASRAALDYDRWLAIPYPTTADQATNEPKIQANLLIADEGADIDRASLLKCHRSKLSRVIVLRSKEDYPRMIASLLSGSVQGSVGLTDEVVPSALDETGRMSAEVDGLELFEPDKARPASGGADAEARVQDSSDFESLGELESPESPNVANQHGLQGGRDTSRQEESLDYKSGSTTDSKVTRKRKVNMKSKGKAESDSKPDLTVQQNLL